MYATGRQKCSMITTWCNCRFCLKRVNCMLLKSTPLSLVCPMDKVLVMFTCKIHFTRSPGAIIAVVQTPAKNPEVRIWKYLSKKLIHHIYCYILLCILCSPWKVNMHCWWEEQTEMLLWGGDNKVSYVSLDGWMDESPHYGYLRSIKFIDLKFIDLITDI